MKSIQVDHDIYTIPVKWNELTQEQVFYLSKLVSQTTSYYTIKLKFTFHVLGLSISLRNPVITSTDTLYFISKNKKRIYLLNTEQIHAITNEMDWIFSREHSEQGQKISINPLITYNPVKQIGVRFTKLKGPDNVLGNITWNEFVFAETFLHRYFSKLDAIWFNMFLATLWRPVVNGNVVPFDQDKVEQWAKRTARIRPHVALICLWYYNGCRSYLSRKYSNVFTGGGKSGDPFDGYMDLTTSLARADATKVADVLNTNLHFTIKALDQMLNTKH